MRRISRLELPDGLAITEARQAAHLCGHHNGVVAVSRSRGKWDFAFPFAAYLYQFSRHVPRDVEGLASRSSEVANQTPSGNSSIWMLMANSMSARFYNTNPASADRSPDTQTKTTAAKPIALSLSSLRALRVPWRLCVK